MEPLGDQSAGPEGDVVVEAGGSKPAAAAGARIQQLVGRAALISEPVGPQLEPDRSLEAQVGDPPGNAQRIAAQLLGQALLLGQTRRYSVELEAAEPHPSVGAGGVQGLGEYAVVLSEAGADRNPVPDAPGRLQKLGFVEAFEALGKGQRCARKRDAPRRVGDLADQRSRQGEQQREDEKAARHVGIRNDGLEARLWVQYTPLIHSRQRT
jgi:hypothetical protein